MDASQANQSPVPRIKELVHTRVKIGEGANAIIFKGSYQGDPCAIKEVHEILRKAPKDQRNAMRDKFENECQRSMLLRHPNIVQFLGVHRPGPEPTEDDDGCFPCLIMELMHCSLHDLIEQHEISSANLTIGLKLSLLRDVTRGLMYLHKHNPVIIHRDLSTKNVLVSTSMVAKISDFGSMCFVDLNPVNLEMSIAPGNPDFLPQNALVENAKYGTDIDIFSLACVCLHTLSEKWPEADRRQECLNAIANENFRKFLRRCLDDIRTNCPDITEVYNEINGFLDEVQVRIFIKLATN